MSGIDEKEMVVLRKGSVYLSSQTEGSRDLFTSWLGLKKLMAAYDIVTYNGIQMRRDYAESLEQAQRAVSYRVKGSLVPRIHFGQETYPMVTPGSGLCPCCSAARGQLHELLCERE